jgi:threonine dehydrogenase-like Zn-dependent dehydrogenase
MDPGIPGFPMHEVVGEVIASRDRELAVGDLVVGWASRSGGLADVVVNDAADLHAYQLDIPPVDAVVMQPLACVLAAFDEIGDVRGKPVTVLGQGPIGLLFSHVATSRGASCVTGVDRVDRGDVAEAFGIDRVVHSSTDRWAAAAAGRVDGVIIESIGHQVGTLTDAVLAAADRTRIHYFGIPDDDVYPVPWKSVLRKRLTLSAGWTVPADRRAALRSAERYLERSPDLAANLVTDVVMIDEAPRAYAIAADPRSGRLKVVIDFRVDPRLELS